MSLLGPNHVLSLDSANPGSGPVSTATVIAPDMRDKTYLSMDNNIRSKVDNNNVPKINLHRQDAQQYINNKHVNFTGREQISPTVVEQTGLKGNNTWNNLSIKDAKTTTNETTNFSYAGNAEREDMAGNWWRYSDAPKTTTNETTNFSYAGNAEREDFAGNWWRYSDAPKTTTNETTNFSYSGDVAPVTSHIQTNRQNFTGDGHTSGVTKWSQQALTLVENYVPGSNGSMNIQLNAKNKIGKPLLKEDLNSLNTNGVSNFNQAVPNGERYQQIDKNIIGKTTMPANKYINLDDRQVENYVVDNLTKNPLSIYRNKKNDNNDIPSFFASSNQNDYNSINTYDVNNSKMNNDINSKILTNNSNNNNNSLLFQTKNVNDRFDKIGKVYSGNINDSGIMFDNDSNRSSRYLNRVKN